LWLYEHEAKELFAQAGIPVPEGGLASSPEEAVRIGLEVGFPVAVKAQILGGGRGKAGGILFAEDEEELRSCASHLLGSTLKGHVIRKVRVERKVRARRELFLSFIVDRSSKAYSLLASREGGVDVELLAKRPGALVKFRVDPVKGLRPFEARKIAKLIGYRGRQMLDLSRVIYSLFEFSQRFDAELAEINPLMETEEGFVAADARVVLDDNSLYRHPELSRILEERLSELPEDERRAKEWGIAYVALDGNIGVIGNGAGLVMATLDMVSLYGGRPADFLDIGGGASAERVSKALSILVENPRVKVILINVLGGITRCDEVATGIVEVMRSRGIRKPVVVRMVGTREEEGRRILEENGVHVLDSMEEAAKKAVKLVEE